MSNNFHELTLSANPTYIYVGAFIDELQRAGTHHVVICPGSRSTPLALAFADHPQIQTWLHIDERSAAFFAMGMAKRLHRPVALLCTSGTAAANFLPALVEAHLTRIPLLVITADRPHELRDCGAPQAIDQNRLYGSHVKWFVEVALPEATNTALRYIRTLANRATALSQAVPAGPVHLNFPLREPLTPEPLPDQPLSPVEMRDALAWYGRSENAAYVSVQDTLPASASTETLKHLTLLVQSTSHGLIIAGPQDNPTLTVPLVQLAKRLGYPILADPLSQLRSGNQANIIASYDAFLRTETFVTQSQPELILRFGAMPVAKPLLLYLKRYAHCPQIIVDGQSTWEEPTLLASEMLHVNPVAFCQDLLTSLENEPDIRSPQTGWLTNWQYADQLTRQSLLTAIETFPQPFEGRIFTELSTLLPDGATLFAGNSMPIRDMDTFFWHTPHHIYTLGNRGANGIDGIISSALGVSAVAHKSEPTVLVIGDLSFFHDLNGLLAAHLHKLNLTIILVNNDGGGIFSFLPQANHPTHFEQLFGTPTGLAFGPVIQMYGGHYEKILDWEMFRKAVSKGIDIGGLHVIEVKTERTSNVTMHRQLWQTVENALQEGR